MSSYSPERQAEAVAHIDEHLRIVGCKEWKSVFAMFPEIPETSMWRWIGQRKRVAEAIGAVASPSVLEETTNKSLREIKRHHSDEPLPPGTQVAVLVPDKSRSLDVSQEIPRMFSDALLLRAFAMKKRTNEDGLEEEAIKNPIIFEKSIMRRIDLIDTMLRVTKEAWDIRAAQDFYRILLEEVEREAPPVARRIMARLAELSSRRGGGMGLRV